MPRYHFDVFDGRTALDDAFGDTFADASEAMDQAAGLLADAARDVVARDRAADLGVVVRDERGVDLYWAALMFRDSRVTPERSRHRWTAPLTAPDAGSSDLIGQSRQLQTSVEEAWLGFLESLADVTRTLQGMGAEARRPG